MADKAGNQEDRYDTDVQRTTESATHERGTANDWGGTKMPENQVCSAKWPTTTLFGIMAEEAGNQEDRYDTDDKETEAEKVKLATGSATHERGTARNWGTENHSLAGSMADETRNQEDRYDTDVHRSS
jgi:hypothetical protein